MRLYCDTAVVLHIPVNFKEVFVRFLDFTIGRHSFVGIHCQACKR